MVRRRLAPWVAVLLALVPAAGCGGASSGGEAPTSATSGPAPTTATTAAPGTDATPGATPTVAEPAATGTQAEDDDVMAGFLDPADTGEAEPSSDARLTVTDVRVGAHGDFDRVVLEVAGTGTPGWSVRYVERAVEEGSGKAVDFSGDGVLEVVLTGMGYPFDTGQTEWADGPLTTEGYAQVWEVDLLGTFEGRTQAFVGLKDAGRPFRVFALGEPERVVVDVQH